jgi:hypothetical protein
VRETSGPIAAALHSTTQTAALSWLGKPHGNVDWDGQHCRFCRFFSLVSGVSSSRMPDSSRFAGSDNLTFCVMGGKSGTIAARNGKGGGKNGAVWWGCGRVQAATRAVARA